MSACATPGAVRLEDQNIPLKTLQKAVLITMPQGKRRVSVNGRELFSNYFVIKRGRYEKALGNEKIRYSAHILILGDRRPYTLEVLVYKERRGFQGYRREKIDEGIARVVLRRIQKALTKRRDDLNIIDDFRVF